MKREKKSQSVEIHCRIKNGIEEQISAINELRKGHELRKTRRSRRRLTGIYKIWKNQHHHTAVGRRSPPRPSQRIGGPSRLGLIFSVQAKPPQKPSLSLSSWVFPPFFFFLFFFLPLLLWLFSLILLELFHLTRRGKPT